MADEAASRGRARRRGAIRRVGGAHGRRPLALPRRRALQASAARRSDASGPPANRHLAGIFRSHAAPHPPPRGLRPHRPGHEPRRRARRGELLHLVPRAGQGLVLEGTEGEGASPATTGDPVVFKKSPFGVPLAGCPLEERISEFHKLKSEGWAIGALAMIVVDNPTVLRDGPSHLQRLHEVVHLPAPGPGGHPAGGDAHAEGRARAAVGLRDLFAAHALESAEPAPPAAACRKPASACSSSAWVPRDSRWRII